MKVNEKYDEGYLILPSETVALRASRVDRSLVQDQNYNVKDRKIIFIHHEIMHYYNAIGVIKPALPKEFYQQERLDAYQALTSRNIVVVIKAMREYMVFLPEHVTQFQKSELLALEMGLPPKCRISGIAYLYNQGEERIVKEVAAIEEIPEKIEKGKQI